MTRITLFFVFILVTVFRSTGQDSYGFGFVVAVAKNEEGEIYKSIFFTQIVNLDSLSGHSVSKKRSLNHRRNVYIKRLNKWVKDLINTEQPKLMKQVNFTYLSQVEFNPGFYGHSNKYISKSYKRLGVDVEIIFMDRRRAEKRRSSMLKNAYNEDLANVVLLSSGLRGSR